MKKSWYKKFFGNTITRSVIGGLILAIILGLWAKFEWKTFKNIFAYSVVIRLVPLSVLALLISLFVIVKIVKYRKEIRTLSEQLEIKNKMVFDRPAFYLRGNDGKLIKPGFPR